MDVNQQNRRASDQQIGYITGKMEELADHLMRVAEKLDKLEDKVSEKFTTIETVLKVLKFIGLALVAVLTFKLGSIVDVWQSVFR